MKTAIVTMLKKRMKEDKIFIGLLFSLQASKAAVSVHGI